MLYKHVKYLHRPTLFKPNMNDHIFVCFFVVSTPIKTKLVTLYCCYFNKLSLPRAASNLRDERIQIFAIFAIFTILRLGWLDSTCPHGAKTSCNRCKAYWPNDLDSSVTSINNDQNVRWKCTLGLTSKKIKSFFTNFAIKSRVINYGKWDRLKPYFYKQKKFCCNTFVL